MRSRFALARHRRSSRCRRTRAALRRTNWPASMASTARHRPHHPGGVTRPVQRDLAEVAPPAGTHGAMTDRYPRSPACAGPTISAHTGSVVRQPIVPHGLSTNTPASEPSGSASPTRPPCWCPGCRSNAGTGAPGAGIRSSNRRADGCSGRRIGGPLTASTQQSPQVQAALPGQLRQVRRPDRQNRPSVRRSDITDPAVPRIRCAPTAECVAAQGHTETKPTECRHCGTVISILPLTSATTLSAPLNSDM